MLRSCLFAFAVCIAMPTSAQAELKAFGFSMKRGSEEVKGTLVVDGYSLKQMHSMMRKYCTGGQVEQFTFVGKPRKRRGLVLQKFKTTCAGGPLQRFKGKSSSYEIELIKEGEYKNKHLVEITTSDGAGNIVYLRETIKP